MDKSHMEVSAWGITVLRENGFCSIKTHKNDKNPLDISAVITWPFSKMNDKRVYWGDKIISLQNNPQIKGTFKYGLFVENGKALYVNKDYVFTKEFNCGLHAYPDLNCNYENYVCESMIECESLSPLKLLSYGESIVHIEEWSLFKTEGKIKFDDEEKIVKLLE